MAIPPYMQEFLLNQGENTGPETECERPMTLQTTGLPSTDAISFPMTSG